VNVSGESGSPTATGARDGYREVVEVLMAWGVVQCAVTIDESATATTTKHMTFSVATTMKTRCRRRSDCVKRGRCCMALLPAKVGVSATCVLITDKSHGPCDDGPSRFPFYSGVNRTGGLATWQ
jgi:hypothetical protein